MSSSSATSVQFSSTVSSLLSGYVLVLVHVLVLALEIFVHVLVQDQSSGSVVVGRKGSGNL